MSKSETSLTLVKEFNKSKLFSETDEEYVILTIIEKALKLLEEADYHVMTMMERDPRTSVADSTPNAYIDTLYEIHKLFDKYLVRIQMGEIFGIRDTELHDYTADPLKKLIAFTLTTNYDNLPDEIKNAIIVAEENLRYAVKSINKIEAIESAADDEDATKACREALLYIKKPIFDIIDESQSLNLKYDMEFNTLDKAEAYMIDVLSAAGSYGVYGERDLKYYKELVLKDFVTYLMNLDIVSGTDAVEAIPSYLKKGE